MGYNVSENILPAKTDTGAGETKTPRNFGNKSFQTRGYTSSGAGASVIRIDGSNVPTPTTNDWITIKSFDELTLGTTPTGAGWESTVAYRHYRAYVVSISGTGATMDVYMAGA